MFISRLIGGGILIPSVRTSEHLFSFSHLRNSSRLHDDRLGALRNVSSREKGLSGTVKEQIDRNSRQEAKSEADHPRLGIGLPMSNIYAT